MINNDLGDGNGLGKVLVTGGAGFVGSHVVDRLVELGFKVVVIDDLSRGFRENVMVDSNVKFVHGNICNKDLVFKMFEKEQFDYVFHFAAQSAIGLSNFIKRYNYGVNVIGSINLINASIMNDVKCFVFTSSIGVYGSHKPGKSGFYEDKTIPMPQDPYSISKYAIELELMASKRMFDLNYIILRPYNVYGPRQDIGDKYRNVVGIFMKQALNNEPITLVGKGEQSFAFTHISDIDKVIAGSVLNKKAYNQVFNIGTGDKPVKLKELAKFICEGMGCNLNIDYIPKRKGIKEAYSNINKAKKILKLSPKMNIEQGIEETCGWVKKTGVKRVLEVENIEILKNLPDSWKKKGEDEGGKER